MSTGYLISSLAWSVVGFLLGRLTVNVDQIRRKMDADKPDQAVSEGEAVPTDVVVVPESTPVSHSVVSLRRPSWTQILGAVFVVMALITIVGVFVQTHRLNAAIECNNSAYHAYADAFKARDEASVASRANAKAWASSSDVLLSSILLRPPSVQPTAEERAQIQSAIGVFQASTKRYIASLDESSRVRAVNPLPAKPCGEV